MKMIFKTGILLLILSALLILSYKVITTVQQKKIVSNAIQTLPDFTVADLNGLPFSNSNLEKNTPVIFIYFNSTCDFCQHEAESIRENIQLFDKMRLLFLSSESPELIRNFARTYGFAEYENVTFLTDANSKLALKFGISTIPSTLVYGKDLKLVRSYNGQVKAGTIIKEL
ncbi:MAG: TlpA disulfide reductase family protein [Agriterribacter sp.]